MKTAKTKGVYSLWLMPGGHLATQLQALITQLSNEHSTPKFEPHVTLIGELAISEKEAVTKTRQLAKMLRPFTIALREVTWLNEYFRCVFIRAEKTPDLLSANSKACEVFEQPNDTNYMPHLSLVYGDLTRPVKEQIIGGIGQESYVDFEVKGISLYYTNRQPQEWHPILEAPLTGQKNPL
jgi:2'-5' RNA ligase